MDRETRRRFEAWRAEAPDPQNTVVDDLFAGECDRAGFIQRATIFGLGVPAISAALLAAGEAPVAFAKETRGKAGGRLRIGLTPVPKGNLEPWTYQETAALQMGGISGEFLNRNRQNLTLAPELAVSWKPNANASEWTYKLRQGVKFANGKPMTADDVVATYHRLLTDPTSQAGSAFSGVLSDAGVVKVDDSTITFKLDTPTASFPYLTSSTTYQAIILPKDYVGPFEKTPQTTGAFNLVAYTPGVSARYDRNPTWWGGSAPLDGVDVTLGEGTAINNALIGGQLDLLNGIVFFDSRALFNNPNVQIFKARGATHREIPMRVDESDSVLHDKRVRQAIALTLDRPQIIKTLFNGFADLGNDSPFAPVYPSTVGSPGVAQRHKDIRKAKELIAAAGLKPGWKTKLVTYQTAELAPLAQIVKQSVKAIGGNIDVKILTGTQYYSGSPTTTPWLNNPMTITDWGHRGVPNVLLNAALTSKAVPSKKAGTWNAAHFKNKKYDSLVKQFGATPSLGDQRKIAKQIELLLLDQTPVIFPYFYNSFNAGSKKVQGYLVDQLGQEYLSKTSLA
ncbi:MAG: peptide/nickel transport system substrate-binding protein [Gaiellales bacterium]|jgi:peptide/nickel transport system substrate-binding protein|nr:peptide/nickel transport system substrate-binding protein [Gaiellales bacterium]